MAGLTGVGGWGRGGRGGGEGVGVYEVWANRINEKMNNANLLRVKL